MNLKYISKVMLLSFLCFGFALNIQGQNKDLESELDGLALKMFTDTKNKDYEAILEMTHPKVFELVPKETMVTVLTSMFEGTEELSIAISDEIPDYKITEVYKDSISNSEYAFVSYDMSMTMTFHKESFDAEGKDTMIKMMKIQDMDVEFLSDNSMNVFMPNRITILINDETTENKWVMVNYDPNSPIFIQILPTSVIEKAKSYQQELMMEDKKKG